MKLVDVRHATRKNLDEICASLGMSQHDYEIMIRWYHSSNETWAGFYQDAIACLYGVWTASLLSDEAYLWLVTNDLVKAHPFVFVRHSQLVTQKLLKDHRLIHGHVHAGHINSIQWLEWLGVKLIRSKIENGLIPFELKRSA